MGLLLVILNPPGELPDAIILVVLGTLLVEVVVDVAKDFRDPIAI
jgi:hypothetical protein